MPKTKKEEKKGAVDPAKKSGSEKKDRRSFKRDRIYGLGG